MLCVENTSDFSVLIENVSLVVHFNPVATIYCGVILADSFIQSELVVSHKHRKQINCTQNIRQEILPQIRIF